MDTVVLDGVTYVKASVVAKQFRYTSDYISQLCRGKKVDARLVGRTWFVNPDSVKGHKQRKYSKSKSAPEAPKPAVSEQKRVRVAPVLGSKTARRMQSAQQAPQPSLERHLKVHYERDEEALLPTIKKRVEQSPKDLQIELADPKKVRVGGKRKSEVNFTATEIPDVALSGKLKVQTYETESAEQEEKTLSPTDTPIEKKAISSDKKENQQKKVVVLKPKLKEKAREKVVVHEAASPAEPVNDSVTEIAQAKPSPQKTSPVTNKQPNISAETAPETRSAVNSFAPRMVAAQNKVAAPSTLVRISPLIATIAAIMVIVAVFAASAQVDANDVGYQSGVVFQLANFLEMFGQ